MTSGVGAQARCRRRCRINQCLHLRPRRRRQFHPLFRRPTFGTQQIDVTIDDPKAYTRPFTVRVNHRLMVDQEMIEFICNENERSTSRMAAPAWMKGQPPRQLGPNMPLRAPAR